MTVYAATAWKSNAHMIADVAKLGYLDGWVLDPTYGKGTWWKKYRPVGLVHHDLAVDGVDFRALPYVARSFDAVAFDPPYVSVGGRSTSGIKDMYDRYGLIGAPTSPAGVQALIDDGLAECARVSDRYVLVKCQSYVSSGKLYPGVFRTQLTAQHLDLELVDMFQLIGGSRPQPKNRKQVHSRNNYSTLLVFRRQPPYSLTKASARGISE